MGIDIVFKAIFPTAKPAAVRFVELCSVVSRSQSFRGPLELSVYESTNAGNPVSVCRSNPSTPGLSDAMLRLVAEHGSDNYSFRSTWAIRGTRAGRVTTYSVDVTARAPVARRQPGLERDVDVTWDIGDSRRYTPEGKDDYPDVEQVISDLRVLIELGASSVWASGPGRTLTPLELFAVYHRDPNDYRHDGLPQPLPQASIDEADIEVAEEYARKEQDSQRLLPTPAGPIVYSPLLVRGTLNMFYTYLDEVVRAGVLGEIERTRGASYRAYQCRENADTWIAIERRSDAAELVRIDAVTRNGEALDILYTIIEPGIDDQIVRALVHFVVLEQFYANAYRASTKLIRFRNLASGKENVIPFDPG
jgi:hypothetical protein